jgi:hypothetical protein
MPAIRNRLLLPLAGIACATALAACGSSSSNSSGAASANSNAFVTFARCMRAHGLTNFPDPTDGGGGIQLNANSGLNPQSPGFQDAQKACNRYLPGGGPGSRKPTEEQKELAIQQAQCMRTHGVPNFPDPVLTPPTPGPNELIIGRDGLFFVFGPGIDPQSPAFQAASKGCGIPIPPASKPQASG